MNTHVQLCDTAQEEVRFLCTLHVKITGQLCRTKECQVYRAAVQDKGMSRLQGNCAGQRNVKSTGQLCRTKECQGYRATVQDKGMSSLQGSCAGQRNVKATGQLCRTKECQDYRAAVQDKGMSRLQGNCAGQRNDSSYRHRLDDHHSSSPVFQHISSTYSSDGVNKQRNDANNKTVKDRHTDRTRDRQAGGRVLRPTT